MKRSKEYILLFAVILGVGLYLALRSSDGVHYELPRLEGVSPQNVDRIAIETGNRSLSLRETNGTWRMTGTGYEAEGDTVQQMLRQVTTPGLTALVSESGDYSRYHLDPERRIEVRAGGDGEILRQLSIGKSAGQVGNCYVKLPEDPNVYMAERDLRGTFDTTAQKLRDKTVFRLDPHKVRSLRLSSRNASREFRRSAQGNATGAWETARGDAVQGEPIEDLLRNLESLRCREYKRSLSRNGTRYAIRVDSSGTHSLSLFAPDKKHPGAYEAQSSQSADPFELPGYMGKEISSSVKELLNQSSGRSDPPQ